MRRNATSGVNDFDLSGHRPYGEKAPNALDPPQMKMFLGKLLQLYLEHYAFAYLGFLMALVLLSTDRVFAPGINHVPIGTSSVLSSTPVLFWASRPAPEYLKLRLFRGRSRT